jgi:RNA-splicing ligase RtcB
MSETKPPQAYKDIDVVMAAHGDLVDIRVALSPLAVIKG